MNEHPIRLTVADDLRRSRLTVFFRLLLALPHLVWLVLWAIAAWFAAVASWFVTLFTGQSPLALHRFLAAFVRYTTHVNAFVFLAANPFPGFTGKAGRYPIDVEIDPPARQSRWKTGFRFILAFPALLIAAALLGSGTGSHPSPTSDSTISGPGVALVVAFLAWFACLARGRMPRGFRDLLVYALQYGAETAAYLLLLTDRYPNSDPRRSPVTGVGPDHPIRMVIVDNLQRSRVTVFFRYLLAIPHLVWFFLWGFVALLAVFANWLAALVLGRSPRVLHRFLAAFIRYETHVFAYLFLVANPFPEFAGRSGSYPVDIEIAPPERQRRWITAIRLPLAVPALFVSSALGFAIYVIAFLAWFAALFTGRMPEGLRTLGAFGLRYSAQVSAYLFVLTDRYPYSGPVAGRPPAAGEPE